jgi:hypothetical protein
MLVFVLPVLLFISILILLRWAVTSVDTGGEAGGEDDIGGGEV